MAGAAEYQVMSVALDILTALQPDFPPCHVVLDTPPGKINVEKWRRVEQRTGDPQVTYLLGALPDPPSRNDIIGLRDASPVIRRRRVAVAALMWGYGIFGARRNEWVSNISAFLASPDLDAVLESCHEKLAAGSVAAAYELFTTPERGSIRAEKYRGLGSAYFTKILYFLARNAPPGNAAQYPLILDGKVSWALAQLTSYRQLVRPASYRPCPDCEAYAWYVTTMHAWAARLNVLPEVIEYYLWREAGKRSSRLWAECVDQHKRHWP
jgi:hypothetical protein